MVSRVPAAGDAVEWTEWDPRAAKWAQRDGLFLAWSTADHVAGVIVVAIVLLVSGHIKTPPATACRFPKAIR